MNGHKTNEILPSSSSSPLQDSDAPTVLLPPYYDTICNKSDDTSEFNNLDESEVRRFYVHISN